MLWFPLKAGHAWVNGRGDRTVDMLDMCEGARCWKGIQGFCPVHQIGAETTKVLIYAREMIGEPYLEMCRGKDSLYPMLGDETVQKSLTQAIGLVGSQMTTHPFDILPTIMQAREGPSQSNTGPRHLSLGQPVNLGLAPFWSNKDGDLVDVVICTLAAQFKDKALEIQALGTTCQDEKSP